MEREVEVEPGVGLWVQDLPADPQAPGPPGEPVLLLAAEHRPGLSWPDELTDRLRARHRVLRYDHRDTGRSAHAFEDRPYAVADLAADAVAVLDACGIARAHVLGSGMGATLAQLMLLDDPDRLASATLLGCAALPGPGDPALPGPTRDIVRMWQEMADPRDERGELAWRVEYRRRLHGTGLPFDGLAARAHEQRLIAHAGRCDAVTVHDQADVEGLERGDELAGVTVPTLVVEAPEDPVYPPPHAAHLAERIGAAARLVRVEGMGHDLSAVLAEPLAGAVLAHAAAAEAALRA